MNAEPIIKVVDLAFSYNGASQLALQNLSLEIPEGSVTAILGPNGSGKSTLLRLLLGALSPQSGSITLAGRPLATYSRRERGALIGLVPQDEHIPFNFSVLEYVLMGRAPYLGILGLPSDHDRRLAQGALDWAGLQDLGERKLPSLSGGERQLAKLTRALVQSPRILLLDEPTAHLDLSNTRSCLDMIRSLSATGSTTVLTTHDPNAAAAIADTIILLRDGEVFQAGRPAEVLTSEKLSATYAVPVLVEQIGDRRAILLDL